MLNSLEEYFSGLSFELPEAQNDEPNLDAGERAFVEKYLGQDTLDKLTSHTLSPVFLPVVAENVSSIEPELMPLPLLERPKAGLELKDAPEIVVAPARAEPKVEIVVSDRQEEKVHTAVIEEIPVNMEQEISIKEAELQEKVIKEAASGVETSVSEVILDGSALQTAVRVGTEGASAVVSAEISQRDKMRQATEIQVVSFFVAGQLFLLPVAGIQEVLRYMELVKVPQAPDFIAGAINLRGTVIPLIHLSALLTNSTSWTYDEHSFIIVTGAEDMQLGLIIDKVSSMHLIPQQKIIWNVESKLGEAGEFLNALVDLDDRVCGMVAPEMIKQKLFSEF